MDSIDEQRFKRLEEQLQEIPHVLRWHVTDLHQYAPPP